MKRVLENKRIFLVEDDPTNLNVYAISLRQSGATVLPNMGYRTIEQIEECLPVDLIVLDILLNRDIDGYDVYQYLQKNSRLRDIPVVVVTSMDSDTGIPKAKALGMNGFMGKPINTMQFANLLARVIGGEKVWLAGRGR